MTVECFIKDKTFEINIMTHAVVLFIFLTIFFWVFITKIIVTALNKQIDQAIRNNFPRLVNYKFPSNLDWTKVDKIVNNLNTTPVFKQHLKNFINSAQKDGKIPWSADFIQNINQQFQGEDPEIKANNKKYFIINIVVAVSLVMCVGIAIFYYRRNGYSINYKKVIIENVILFIFIGFVEYMFFTRIVSQYIPASPAYMIASAMDSIKNQLILDQNNV